MGNAFGWPHLLIILAVILLLFGAAKLPALAKSVGQSARVFKGEMKAMKDEDVPPASTPPTVVTPPTIGIANSTASTTAPDSVSGPSEPKP
ncbi:MULTISPECIES: twin-arginine translocase TatA/TatE family subunit [unclassified Microbacterium]|uniref:twin-arginine translocase TatA/TatE family subunit n=1 Tax=unclassified Microbacterium TaxID=2609290 RepID=UPI00214B0445|nr:MULTISPECIES: twin-arginine translocase TatA/TatE family subunit [unclassified Microbacterium]MCR2785750.1 twin-arginine translocase TatA/TatE family subunit [Microbacterium sp. zg.B96]MDL5350134.1 twin-arginine translocase TatA/TatE family subunit [Microbacterium sp. zg-YB36]WIM17267.1 twin-arginine translocase TatA/TatE family subunit [Microbacterium sp. zg-B96]